MTRIDSELSLRDVFDDHAAYVLRSLRHLGVAESDIEDVGQEVFVTVHRRLSTFEGRSKLRTWLYGICLRVASDYRRRAHIRREKATADPGRDLADAVERGPDAQAQARSELRSLLDELDDDKRDVVVLYEIEGFSMKEVAEIVGCPLQTAYSRLHAARDLMLARYQAKKAGGMAR
jgi:RNA polymerase sigma-70 factor (ECF subfamily)